MIRLIVANGATAVFSTRWRVQVWKKIRRTNVRIRTRTTKRASRKYANGTGCNHWKDPGCTQTTCFVVHLHSKVKI